MVSQELLNELKLILKEEFNLNLSLGEVSQIAAILVGYFDLLLKVNYSNRKEESYGYLRKNQQKI